MEPDDRKPQPPPGDIFDLAERAVEYVRKALGIVLDYAPETLPVLDHYLGDVPTDQEETVALVATTAGAYFGEVCRRAIGGEWRDGALLTLASGLTIRPAELANAAIMKDELDEDEAGDDYDVPAAARVAVEEVLAGKEVPVDEYYSLSGRYEAILLICDVLASRVTPPSTEPTEPDAD